MLSSAFGLFVVFFTAFFFGRVDCIDCWTCINSEFICADPPLQVRLPTGVWDACVEVKYDDSTTVVRTSFEIFFDITTPYPEIPVLEGCLSLISSENVTGTVCVCGEDACNQDCSCDVSTTTVSTTVSTQTTTPGGGCTTVSTLTTSTGEASTTDGSSTSTLGGIASDAEDLAAAKMSTLVLALVSLCVLRQ